jgi:hypothetical protein
VLLDDADVVLGLTAVNSLSCVLGAMVGQAWLRRRLGRVETKRTLITLRNCLLAAVPAVGAVLGLRALLDLDGSSGAVWGAWLDLVLTTVVVGGGPGDRPNNPRIAIRSRRLDNYLTPTSRVASRVVCWGVASGAMLCF